MGFSPTHSARDISPVQAWARFKPSTRMPWNTRLAAHLHRRAGFGATAAEIHQTQADGVDVAIEKLFEQTQDETIESEMAAAARLVSSGQDSRALASWWLLRMVKTRSPFREKMTLFWHGHFATGADKVKDSRAMLRQNQLLRKHALAQFPPLVEEISQDVAMLVYLDSEENRKTRPNENYARELMELFCLGPGNYSEEDIKEVARCFTGWEIRKHKFRFNNHQHDAREKSVLGAKGNYDGNDAIKIVLSQPAAPRFIAKKLVRYFVSDELELTDKLVGPLAKQLRESDFDIAAAMKTILSSNIFFSDLAMGKKIKSPVELAVGFLRFFDASTNMNELQRRLAEMGQLPFYPPNVKGWPGGRSWINASSILARANLVNDILFNSKTKYAAGNFGAAAKQQLEDGENVIARFAEHLLATKLDDEKNKVLKDMVGSAGRIDRETFSWLATNPEFQLN